MEGNRINLPGNNFRVKQKMFYDSLGFHSCFPDEFHSGPLTFSLKQVLSL